MALTPFFLLLLITVTGVTAEPAHPGYADADSTCGVAEEAVAVPERREEFDGGRIIDNSHYYREEMPGWESADGTGGFLRLVRSMRNGSDIANFSELRLTAHSGTHVDAPGHVFEHYYDAGFDVDTLDHAILNANVMESLHIPEGVRRVLFRTLNTDRKLMWKKEFDKSYVGFMKDGAQCLIDNTDIRLVGVDYLSVGAFDECISAHLVFLEKRERHGQHLLFTMVVDIDRCLMSWHYMLVYVGPRTTLNQKYGGLLFLKCPYVVNTRVVRVCALSM